MDTGIIAKRYATALLKYVDETGNGPQVYEQVKSLLADPDSAMPLCPELESFTALLIKNGRVSDVKLIFSSFIRLYDESRCIHKVHLVTAVDSPQIREKVLSFVQETVGGQIRMTTEVDPGIIGGFVLEIDDCKLDTSVSRQLEDIRRQLIEKNKRIV